MRRFHALLLKLILAATMVGPWATAAFAYESDASPCARLLDDASPLPAADAAQFQRVADQRNLEIVVLAPNPESRPYRGVKGFAAKPADLINCKTAATGPARGLVTCPPAAFGHASACAREVHALARLGYEVLPAAQDYLVRRRADATFFFSDYDLFSVRSTTDGCPAYDESLRASLNTAFGQKMVRHGPLVEYARRRHVPIKLPLVIFTAGHAPRTVTTHAQLAREFKARGLPRWDAIQN